MTKNIVFDMGQVLIKFDPVQIVKQAGVTGDDVNILVEELMKSPEWSALDRGSISYDDAHASVCRRLPERLYQPAHDIIFGWWKPGRIHMEGMDELVREIKSLGYRVYLLSNAALCLHEYIHTLPGYDCFDGALISADHKLLKPQHEIYEKLYELYGLNPAECLFIDDSPANIEGAMVTGMPGIVFRGDVKRLRRDLRREGINVSE